MKILPKATPEDSKRIERSPLRTCLLVVLPCLLGSCTGLIGGNDSTESDGTVETDPEDLVPRSGLRRMTAAEYFNTMRALVESQSLPVFETLPADARTPFDNDYATQVTSQEIIDSADYLAEQAADDVIADPAVRDKVVGCEPTGTADEACLTSFVQTFGRRALRRPLTADEVSLIVNGSGTDAGALDYAVEADDFYAAVHTVIWALLQHPEFLYRVEIGTPVAGKPNVFQLTQFEVAARLSYFLWGTMPDDALLDRAAAGDLDSSEARKEEALRMLADPRAEDRVTRFHAMWLGYEVSAIAGELADGSATETEELIQRVIFEENLPWSQLLTFPETFLTPYMAEHYGLQAPSNADGDWVAYGDSGRAGLLSHSKFLSIGAKFDDTSPVQRGIAIRERLFCMDVQPAPPGVNVDEPPAKTDDGGFCKIERFNQLATTEGCIDCHKQINPLGYGLENYDMFGAYRTHESDIETTEEDESTCEIPGIGEIPAFGDFKPMTFHGPKELGELAVETGLVQKCLSKQLYRFVAGRSELDTTDKKIVASMQEQMEASDGKFTFQDLVLEMVEREGFAQRLMEEN